MDVSVESWLEKTNYSRQKKKQLLSLYERTLAKGEGDFIKHNNFCKCFIKDESYPAFKIPRAILARKDECKLRLGPIFKLIEEEVFKLPVFVKKVPVVERAKLIRDLFGELPAWTEESCQDEGDRYSFMRRIMNTDYTAFESSFTRDVMMEVEMRLYRFMVRNLPEGPRFLEILDKAVMSENLLVFKTLVSTVLAGRMSGEMNTSLGNGFTNLMLFKFAMFVFGCEHDECLIEGDDCVSSYLGPIIPSSFWSSLGFNIKLVYLKSPNLASFCGQIFDFDSLTVISDPLKNVLNLAWSSMLYAKSTHRTKMGLLRSKALSMLHQYPGCPILQSVARCYVRLTEGFRFKIDMSMSAYKRAEIRRMCEAPIVYRDISYSSRLLMEEVFGFSILEQIEVEQYFDTMKRIEPLYHPVFERHIKPVHRQYDDMYVLNEGTDTALYQFVGAYKNSDV